jgi:hypothetical protein
MAGFLAFGVLGYVVDGNGDTGDSNAIGHWGCLALAALLGLVAKDPDKIAWAVISKALNAIKASIPDTSKQDDEPKKD